MIKIQILLASLLLSVSSVVSAITVHMGDNALEYYVPTNDYIWDVVVGGSEIYTAGLMFTDPSHAIIMDVNVPGNLIGILELAITSGPNVTGTGYVFDSLTAGQATSYQFGNAWNASISNPVPVYVSLRAASMPPLTSYPGIVASPVPVPPAVWLFGSGLLGLLGVARHKPVTA